jgi:SagB-type dehydrogenase family enzyme
MRLRRSRSLIIFIHNDKPVLYNYIAQIPLTCNIACIDLLAKLTDWTHISELSQYFNKFSAKSLAQQIVILIKSGCLVVDNTPESKIDEEFESSWLWGHLAGLYHFGTKYGEFIPTEIGDAIQKERIKKIPSPPLYTSNDFCQEIVNLPTPAIKGELFSTMFARRTNRILADESIPLSVVSECLFFSMRITTILKNPDIIDLPLKMTPSGGARNPYEVYVCARKIKDINPGIYHYSAIDHTLGCIKNEIPPDFRDLCAGQDWASNASCLLVLVANFERPMWKYRDPFAYKVVVIEAGHIAQNIMLAATKQGYAANPTCAISDDLLEKTLELSGITKSVMYVIVLGKKARQQEWSIE